MPTPDELLQILGPDAFQVLKLANGSPEDASKIGSLIKSMRPGPNTEKEKTGVLSQLGAVDQLGRAFKDLQNSGTSFEKALGQGIGSGIVGEYVTGPTQMNPAVDAFDGQRKYAAVSLAKIATGNRPAAETIKYFFDTLPKITSNNQTFARHTYNAVLDAFTKKAAIEGYELGSDPQKMAEAENYANAVVQRWIPPDEFAKFKSSMANLKPSVGLPKIQFGPTLDLGADMGGQGGGQ